MHRVLIVDLGESFPTSSYYLDLFSIYLQKLASIQPRTTPIKFAASAPAAPPEPAELEDGQTIAEVSYLHLFRFFVVQFNFI